MRMEVGLDMAEWVSRVRQSTWICRSARAAWQQWDRSLDVRLAQPGRPRVQGFKLWPKDKGGSLRAGK